jgi:hypothetical protein
MIQEAQNRRSVAASPTQTATDRNTLLEMHPQGELRLRSPLKEICGSQNEVVDAGG